MPRPLALLAALSAVACSGAPADTKLAATADKVIEDDRANATRAAGWYDGYWWDLKSVRVDEVDGSWLVMRGELTMRLELPDERAILRVNSGDRVRLRCEGRGQNRRNEIVFHGCVLLGTLEE